MKNSIVERIADFLKDYQPFDSLSYPELITIATSIKVATIEKNKTLFQIDDVLHDSFYVVASGSVNLSVISDAEENLLSICRTGDIFGLRPFFAKNNYMITAKAREESIVFAIPIVTFKPLLSENSKVLDFLLESFASTATFSKEKGGNKISDTVRLGDTQSEIQYFQALSYSKTPITSSATTSILEVAKLMTEHAMDNVLITKDNFPVGIVTDRDFRAKVATGQFSITTSIDTIMSSPVITVAENPSLAEAQLLMLKHHVSHMCVTTDGTDKSEIKGIITEHDLVVAQANNPGVLIKEIRRSSNAAELKKVKEKLLELIRVSITKNISISHISMISGEIIFALTKQAVTLAIIEIGPAPARFAWLNIGSQGRKEQILLSDQDSMLVFEDVEPERYRDVKDYFFKLAKKVTSILENVGFESSPNGHVASNFLWCKSLTDWKKQYSNWINTLGEKNDQIENLFFDYDLAYGELELEDALTDTIFKNTKNNSLFFDYLGNETLKKPVPLNFFKKFNVEEEEGENKGKFDIKTRALMPLVDGARLLVLSQNIKGINNTYLRFKKLAIVEPKYEEVYLNCAEAFLILSKYRTLEGLKNDNSGQYIDLNEISKSDKEKLKNSFLAFKELEEVIKDKFQLTHFS